MPMFMLTKTWQKAPLIQQEQKKHQKNGEDLHSHELHGTMNFLHTNIDR
jgi:hypothetical protein